MLSTKRELWCEELCNTTSSLTIEHWDTRLATTSALDAKERWKIWSIFSSSAQVAVADGRSWLGCWEELTWAHNFQTLTHGQSFRRWLGKSIEKRCHSLYLWRWSTLCGMKETKLILKERRSPHHQDLSYEWSYFWESICQRNPKQEEAWEVQVWAWHPYRSDQPASNGPLMSMMEHTKINVGERMIKRSWSGGISYHRMGLVLLFGLTRLILHKGPRNGTMD